MPVRKTLFPGKRREPPVPKLLCRKGFRQHPLGVGKLPQAGEQARFRAAAQGGAAIGGGQQKDRQVLFRLGSIFARTGSRD